MLQLQIIQENKISNIFRSYDYETDTLSVNKIDYRGKHTFYKPKNFINNNENVNIYKAFADKRISDRHDLLNFEINSRLKFDIFDVYTNNITGENNYCTKII